ncbi:unnamed protein product, partial [Bubo scandiacus]
GSTTKASDEVSREAIPSSKCPGSSLASGSQMEKATPVKRPGLFKADVALPSAPQFCFLCGGKKKKMWGFFATGNSHPDAGSTSCCCRGVLPSSPGAGLHSSGHYFLLGASPSSPELAA